ncbi:hypothetical protein PTE01_24910 [Pseudoalteromonas tetraodonis GFC]|uniref:Uncharacterized protein n=1 Tax=Pseudoalteromonas tetraodonis GFC TaxID=1315271 RepID=A0AA37S0Z1_9GAMM|nr:hypothetical protein [Pseudoalteromonas tetraodonis]ATD03647.1 hypothetical protein PTET_a2299 [Pseudoalteromonas tetraodonis]GEN39381.1 hypothetical protein PTE01_24910 [Pseudoalteromonas tetraodonis GFC]GLQ01421.1 hypothetical protein GCM10007914_03020 [Pseudoalteromonas tetraodonis GFC]|tara:strand:- start:122 stop:745 length:624 start_codon:yes stop_codon:yes gene_type:complete
MESLLERSNLLLNELNMIISLGPNKSSKRCLGSWVMCDIAIEHAHSLQNLMEIGNCTSAISLLRLQFDALTRSVWLLWGASEKKVDRIMQDLSINTANADNGLPSHCEMIKQIDGKAPAEATRMLTEFRDVTWKASSSYVHGGIHAMKRHGEGYPLQLLEQILVNSNGLVMLSAVHLATMTGNMHVLNDITRIRDTYRNILPKLNFK